VIACGISFCECLLRTSATCVATIAYFSIGQTRNIGLAETTLSIDGHTTIANESGANNRTAEVVRALLTGGVFGKMLTRHSFR
jgi:hypothetical protein